jgi:hypothetical protein
MSSQFNNLIKSKSIASITPQQILAAGESIFLDVKTSSDLNSINKAIPAYQHIHSPNYGQPIPLSGSVVSVDGAETLLAPGNNEIRKIISINVENTGGAPVLYAFTLGGMIVAIGAADPSATSIVSIGELYASKTLPLAVAITSGTAGDLTSSVASILVAQ